MDTIAVPSRITIDFRAAIHPSRTWILGLGASDRVELLGFDEAPAPSLGTPVRASVVRARPTALSAPCTCPDFCERDHANE